MQPLLLAVLSVIFWKCSQKCRLGVL